MKKSILFLAIMLCPILVFGQLGDYYSSNGHPKAKGLNFQIKKPLGFEQNEADRPNIVQKWEKNKTNNDEYLAFMIIVKKLDPEVIGFSKSDWTKYLKDDGGVKDFASAFENPINEKFLVIDNFPAAGFDASQEVSRLDFKIRIYFSQIMVIVNNHTFLMQFQSTKKNNLERNKSLFYQLANSVIFTDQYK